MFKKLATKVSKKSSEEECASCKNVVTEESHEVSGKVYCYDCYDIKMSEILFD